MKLIFLLIASLAISSVFGQGKETKSFLDENKQPVREKDASYLVIWQKNKKAGKYCKTLYNIQGPRISKENFADPEGRIREGKCLYYKSTGALDSSGNYKAGVQEGLWYFYAENGDVARAKKYNNGALINDTLFTEGWNESVQPASSGHSTTEARLAEGDQGWTRFLLRNLRYPLEAQQLRITGRIMLQFIVDENGNVLEPDIRKSTAYSLDEEALRLIRISPPWSPASKDGIGVSSYKLQPIIFRLE
ncbi:MAG: TonB family protein [Williamsia sp.]|nr:TonB family protein [Williamsia sp.]